jgi:hypothetical protein
MQRTPWVSEFDAAPDSGEALGPRGVAALWVGCGPRRRPGAGYEDRRRASRSPSLPNRTGGSPASGFPVGRRRWVGPCGPPIADDRALARWFSTTPTRTASRHYVGPCEMALARPRALPSYAPSLHGRYPLLGYYERSDPGRTLCRPLPWFPDSRPQNFPPFCRLTSAVLGQTRSTPSTLAALFCSGFAFTEQARQNRRPNRVHVVHPFGWTLLRTGGSRPVALHPGLWPRCSYFLLLALQCRPGQGLSPCCSDALSGALSRPFGTRPRRRSRPNAEALGYSQASLRDGIGVARHFFRENLTLSN